MLKFNDKLRTRSGSFSPSQLVTFLDVDTEAHRRIYRDAQQAFVMMMIFFPELLSDKIKVPFDGSRIVDQKTRAQHFVDRRTFKSNKYIEKGFWKEWDDVLGVQKHGGNSYFDGSKYPVKWNIVLRPIIAKREPHKHETCQLGSC